MAFEETILVCEEGALEYDRQYADQGLDIFEKLPKKLHGRLRELIESHVREAVSHVVGLVLGKEDIIVSELKDTFENDYSPENLAELLTESLQKMPLNSESRRIVAEKLKGELS